MPTILLLEGARRRLPDGAVVAPAERLEAPGRRHGGRDRARRRRSRPVPRHRGPRAGSRGALETVRAVRADPVARDVPLLVLAPPRPRRSRPPRGGGPRLPRKRRARGGARRSPAAPRPSRARRAARESRGARLDLARRTPDRGARHRHLLVGVLHRDERASARRRAPRDQLQASPRPVRQDRDGRSHRRAAHDGPELRLRRPLLPASAEREPAHRRLPRAPHETRRRRSG